MLRAIIFDCDGILVDSEPLLLQFLQVMALAEGWKVTEEEYAREYLVLDDRHAIEHLYRLHGQTLSPKRLSQLLAWKNRAYGQAICQGLPSFPGVADFVHRAARRYPLAVASGSWRHEVEHHLQSLGLRDAFRLVVAADDCQHSKPHPEIYLKALDRLAKLPDLQKPQLTAAECLAIEDSPGGVQAAQGAGIRCVAVTHTTATNELRHADWVFGSFLDIDLNAIAASFPHGSST